MRLGTSEWWEERRLMPGPSGDHDPMLAALLAATDSAARDRATEQLLGYARTLIDRQLHDAIGRHELIAPDAADVSNEVLLRLMGCLRRFASDPTAEPMARFDDYVATVVHNLLDDHRKRQDPIRSRLASRLRYLLTHTSGLALWSREPPLCGLVDWEGRFQAVPVASLGALSSAAADDARELRSLVIDVLRRSGGPVAFRDLVAAFATALNLEPRPFVPAASLSAIASESDSLARLEGREYLDRLWAEIIELPLRQRHALLLGLGFDHGECVAILLAGLGIARPRVIAETLSTPLPELLSLWNDLPLGDQRIASRLGITRQQVINLRKSARDRLARRMGRPRRSARSGP